MRNQNSLSCNQQSIQSIFSLSGALVSIQQLCLFVSKFSHVVNLNDIFAVDERSNAFQSKLKSATIGMF